MQRVCVCVRSCVRAFVRACVFRPCRASVGVCWHVGVCMRTCARACVRACMCGVGVHTLVYMTSFT